MYLGQVAAAGAQLLPDVGDGVQADHVNSPVRKVQQVLRHVPEHRGIGVIQVPLVGIEVGHDHGAVRKLREAPRRGGGEHLGHRLFKLPGDVPGVVEEIAVPVFRLPRPGPLRPGVVLAGVVHHKVQAQAHSPAAAGVRQGLQILHGPKRRLDLPKIADGVAPVAAALGAFQQGHQVQVVHAALPEVAQLLLHAV